MAFDELKEKLSVVWGSAPWELIAGQMTPLHEHIVRALAPEPGDRWLDVGTATAPGPARTSRVSTSLPA